MKEETKPAEKRARAETRAVSTISPGRTAAPLPLGLVKRKSFRILTHSVINQRSVPS